MLGKISTCTTGAPGLARAGSAVSGARLLRGRGSFMSGLLLLAGRDDGRRRLSGRAGGAIRLGTSGAVVPQVRRGGRAWLRLAGEGDDHADEDEDEPSHPVRRC